MKYLFYEASVQSPSIHVEWFNRMYREIQSHSALSLREDFCGTHAMACEWVKQSARHSAIGLDLDPEPLKFGRDTYQSQLTHKQRERLKILCDDVRTVTLPRVDLAVACNFSFCVFRERRDIEHYFRSVQRSLSEKGCLILEVAGGPGFIEPMRERKRVRLLDGTQIRYVWHQKEFDPIQRRGHYAIHFGLPLKSRKANQAKLIYPEAVVKKDTLWLYDAFQYDWRLWSIPELRESLKAAGFSCSCVYWETEIDGKGSGEYVQKEQGDNAYAWVAYVIGVKGKKVSG